MHVQAGMSAGVVEAVLIVTPFEVVKTRLQQQEGRGANLKYKGAIHCARTVVQQEVRPGPPSPPPPPPPPALLGFPSLPCTPAAAFPAERGGACSASWCEGCAGVPCWGAPSVVTGRLWCALFFSEPFDSVSTL